jgi:hypothetical protein
MMELVDYSGKFDPKFSRDKFARETLLKLLKAYSEYILRIDGFWYLTVMNKWGNDEAFDCDVRVWEKLIRYEMKAISSLLNIRGNDVVTVMKAIQVSPWMSIYEYEIDVKNNDHAIVTIYACPTLFALEKERIGREKLICQELEPKIMGMMAHYFNPDIKVTGLKVPPRTSYKDICCQWEFRLDR